MKWPPTHSFYKYVGKDFKLVKISKNRNIMVVSTVTYSNRNFISMDVFAFFFLF